MARTDLALNRLPLAGKVGLALGMLALVGVAYAVVFYSDLSDKMAAADRKRETLMAEHAELDLSLFITIKPASWG